MYVSLRHDLITHKRLSAQSVGTGTKIRIISQNQKEIRAFLRDIAVQDRSQNWKKRALIGSKKAAYRGKEYSLQVCSGRAKTLQRAGQNFMVRGERLCGRR